jgi:ribosomal protein S18 acetylase RimI-like enzyme
VPSELQRDAWLSEALGFDAYTTTPESAHIKPEGRRALTTCRVPAADVASLAVAADGGFRVVDVNLTLERAGSDGVSSGTVAPATADQHERLLDIAGSCFRYSRFHLDPLLARGLADRVKREWVRSYVEGRRGIELLAAMEDGRAVGFLAVLEAADGARVIDLVGVASDAQGRGVGDSLVATFIHRHGADGRSLRVGTQAANVTSLRLYEKRGFRVASATYVLHRHTGV